jgi:prepilin-type N-terminal cleavage/methylation domain-containing protein
MRPQRAFTLLEILATLLLLAMGVTAVIGMMRYATRISIAAQMRATALAVAETVMNDPTPEGLSADVGDADKDGWYGPGILSAPATGSYSFTVNGWLHGIYLVREETSAVSDIIDDSARWGTVSVHAYAGLEGEHLTSLRRRVLRKVR